MTEKKRAAAPETRTLPVTFSIVGVQKSATTTLYDLLVRHRQIARGQAKERHFFDDETRDWTSPDYRDCAATTKNPRARIAGDATPIYLFWPHALERMRAYNPEMKLIASFRDPIDRAFSQWSMERGRRSSTPDFGEAIADPRFARIPDEIPTDQNALYRNRTLVARGFYGEQLRRGFALFDRAQWLLLDFRSFLAEPAATRERTTDFLGVDRFRRTPELEHRHSSPTNHTGAPPTADDIAKLAHLYAEDLLEFEELSGLDTSAWPTARINAGDLDPADLAAKLARKAGLVG